MNLASDTAALSTEELRERLAGLDRLLHVTRALAGELDLDHTLATIAQAACEALNCERASVYQYDPKRDELYTRVATELEIDEIRHGTQQGITGYVARTRQLANVPDPQSDPRWNSAIDRLTGYQTRNILAAPLASPHDGTLLGVLQLLNRRNGRFDLFDEQLLEAFSQHAAAALDRARLVRELQRRSAWEASLQVAREVQRGFMPSRLPEIPGYELAIWWYPNEAVGGDYCDVVPQDDGRVTLVIADVSGHGLGPSLIMASVRAALRAMLMQQSQPQSLLAALSRTLADDLQEGRFVTILIAELDPQTHRVVYANAGHAPALHYHVRTDRFTLLETTGIPLGILADATYALAAPLQLERGDLLVLCTDGIVEAMDAAGEQFGRARLEALIRAHRDEPLQQLLDRIGAAVTAHYEGDTPPDDLTILAARRKA